jgi:hypothetical protein
MSAYLKKSMALVVAAMSLGFASDAFSGNQSTTNELSTIVVTGYYNWDNPFDVAGGAFNWTIDDYNSWDVGISDNEGGGGGGGDYSPISSTCSDLSARKPMNCPNPIALPNGYAYGNELYPGGSGIPRLLYWIDSVGGVNSGARELARSGLALHTIDIADAFITGDRANERLLLSIQAACRMQHDVDQQNSWTSGTVTHMERNCLEVLERLQAEAGDPGFRGYFFNWLSREGIHLDDLGIPESVLDWLSPTNSLRIRQNAITADTQCAQWWIDAQANQCIP